ncbi:MAG: hypothetical protein DPW18_20240 [Chloroflexi bacterium]|nr:hypothetical protein [Chloroflexota bacterium]MDL1943784.1 BMP family ABC transporter substrate-binding protein [Chloroflexi bacterium CFX2]
MLRKKVIFRSFAALAVCVIILSMAGPAQAACTDPLGCVTVGATDPIHIAYLLDLSGPAAGLGLEEIRGVEIAIDDSGGAILGHTIQFDGQDGTCSNSGGSAAGQVLDDDSTIVAVVGTTCSGEAMGAMPYLSAAGFSVVSPSNTNILLTKPGDPNHYAGYLRVSWNDKIQGETAANYAYTTLGLTTAAVIDNGSPYSAGIAQVFADEFITLGGTITTQQTIDPGDTTDIDAKLAIVAGTSPDLLYIPVFSPEGVYILDNLPAGLTGVQVFGADGLWDPNMNSSSNEEGLLLTSYDFTVTRNSDFVTKFLPAYIAKYGTGPSNVFHSHAYDAFMLIKKAIEAVAVETAPGEHQIGRQALRTALYGTTNHDGLTGNLTCDANGDCADATMSVYRFHSDQFPPEYLAPEKIGLVMDAAGPNDLSFNYMAYQGVLQTKTAFGILSTLYLSSDNTEYQSNLERCADEGNGLCFAVGFSMGDAILNAATARPGTNYAILDFSWDTPPANLRGIQFDAKQVGYLAGTLAGKMSVTGDVGVVAGMEIPPVIAFVEGYRNGAQCSGNIDVLVNYTGTFGDPAVGEAAAADMISRGADVIFAAAGPTGNGAILYSAQNGVWSIGVDTDQYLSVFDDGGVAGSDKLLTSAMKRLDTAVYMTTQDHLNGIFTSGTVIYGLDDNGVGLAPFHETDPVIPQAVKDELDAIKQGIINGTVNIDYPCRPRFHAELVENDVFGVDWLPFTDVTLTIDDPANGAGVDFTDTKTTDTNGFVMFDNLGTIVLAPDMFVGMTDGTYNKTHTIVPLTVAGVDAATDRVWGTGVPGHQLNIQRCDPVGCSWRRWATVQVDGTWQVDFSVPGGPSPEEQNILNILPGMRGEALYPDTDSDHTDVQWQAPILPPFRSTAIQDGWILESSETSGTGGTLNNSMTTLWVGDDGANRQYRTVLSFDTSALPPGAVITSVTLKFKYAGKVGTLPFGTHGNLLVDVRKGAFSNNPSLQLGDFKIAATKNALFSITNTKVNNWYVLTFNPSQFKYINRTGVTQFRLRFAVDDNNDYGADILKIFSGNAGSAHQPRLTIVFYIP